MYAVLRSSDEIDVIVAMRRSGVSPVMIQPEPHLPKYNDDRRRYARRHLVRRLHALIHISPLRLPSAPDVMLTRGRLSVGCTYKQRIIRLWH